MGMGEETRGESDSLNYNFVFYFPINLFLS